MVCLGVVFSISVSWPIERAYLSTNLVTVTGNTRCLPEQSSKPVRISSPSETIILCHIAQLSWSEEDPKASEPASIFWITIVSPLHYI